MQFVLSKKQTAKEAWDAIAVARIGSDRARRSALQALRKEWENLAFKPGEDVDDFALRLSTLLEKMVQFGDDTYDEERAVEKLLRCIPERYKQIARSIESMLDLSTMSIEEAIGRLKVVDDDEPQPQSEAITTGGKLLLTREEWEARQGDKKKGESSSSTGGRKSGKTRKANGGAQGGTVGTRRHLPQLWQTWPLDQGLSTETTWPGPRCTGGGGGASSTSGPRKHRVSSSGTGRSGLPPPSRAEGTRLPR